MATASLNLSAASTISPPRPRPLLGRIRPIPAIAVSLATIAFLPLLYENAQQIWLRPHYQFAPLAILAAVLLSHERIKTGGPFRPGGTLLCVLGFSLCWAVLAASILLESPRMASADFLLFVAMVGYALGGQYAVRDLIPGLALAAFTLPMPFLWDREILLALQQWTTRLSSKVLDSMGIFHVMAGNTLETGGRRFLVEEACSGINSLFVGFASAMAFVFWRRRSKLHSCILLFVFVPCAVLMANILRVTLVGYVGDAYGIDLSVGRKHAVLGIFAFVGMLVLLFSADQFMLFLLEPIPRSPLVLEPSPRPLPPRAPFPIGLACLFAGIFACLIALQGRDYFPHTTVPKFEDPTPSYARLVEDSLPPVLDDWQRYTFEESSRNPGSNFGENSRSWGYRLGSAQATLSLDYPFSNWHDLTICYTSQGWKIVSQKIWPEDKDRFLEVQMEKPGYRSGYLLFREFDRTGELLIPSRGGPSVAINQKREIFDRLMSRIRNEPAPAIAGDDPPLFQYQMFVETFRPLTDAERVQAQRLFRAGYSAIRAKADGP